MTAKKNATPPAAERPLPDDGLIKGRRKGEMHPRTKTKPKPTAEPVAKTAAESVKGNLAVIPPGPPATSTLAIIAGALKDPDFKPENMRLVLDMHKEMMAEQARLDFISAFIALKAELPVINKDGKIEILKKGSDGERVAGRDKVQQSTPYATFENICRAIDPLLQKHGFALSFATEPSLDGNRILIKGILDHRSGHQRTTIFPLPAETSGSKNNVQGWGSAFSYGKRYSTVALLNIRSAAKEDRDLDGNAPPPVKETGPTDAAQGEVLINAKQAVELTDAIADCGVGLPRFLDHYGIDRIEDLAAEKFAEAKKACADYKAKKVGA